MELPSDLAALRRRASLAQVGGFRPPEEPATSWMGTVKLGADWPLSGEVPMHGVLQLVTRELPVRPPALEGVEMLALFVAEDLPVDTPNGIGWCLRTYDTLDGLSPLTRPEWPHDDRMAKGYDPALKPFPLAFSEVEDWPGLDNLEVDLAHIYRKHTHEQADRYEARDGLKVGGWPYCVQSEVQWVEDREVVPDVEFVLQVDSDDKVGFVIADAGVFYVGYRAASDTWHATWQCA